MTAIVEKLWKIYYPKDIYDPKDGRMELVKALIAFFKSSEGARFLDGKDLGKSGTIHFDVQEMIEHFPFDDIESTLIHRPTEFSGALGIAISDIANSMNPYLEEPIVKIPAFFNLSRSLTFSDIKSTTVGQLISLEGHVVKVAPCRPLVIEGEFKCAKCLNSTIVPFEDGIYYPPTVCATKKCYCKTLEFNRKTIRTVDFQRIKLTELDVISKEIVKENNRNSIYDPDQPHSFHEEEIARIPKTMEVELRSSLVNTCIVGDVVKIVGMVKVMQVPTYGAMRYGGKKGATMESGINQFYILASTITCMKSSGDRQHPTSSVSTSAGFLLDNEKAISSFPSSSSSSSHPSSSSSSSEPRNTTYSVSELQMIRNVALSEHNLGILIQSFCPTIYGHELVKLGLLLGLFGGSSAALSANPYGSFAEQEEKSFKVRSNIHVLIVGDPGLGKSQMLRAAATVAPRSVFVTGNTSTTAGLTVTVTRDPGGSGRQGGELCIEAGALVLGDSGICCIDELDKMTSDQHSLLEAMEQQSISIAKSGIVTSLRSRTAVFAAANPVGGHYNRRKSICENLKLNSALLSRFDLVFILLDKPDEDRDQMISEHILGYSKQAKHQSSYYDYENEGEGNHDNITSLKRSISQLFEDENPHKEDEKAAEDMTMTQRIRKSCRLMMSEMNKSRSRGGGATTSSQLSPEQMKRYIEYARQYIHPILTPAAAKVLQKMYLTMRSAQGNGDAALPVTTRHLESMIRLAQARARMELREEVTEQDATDIIQLLQESMLDIYTTESGTIDMSRKGNSSMAKQMKALVKVLNKEAMLRNNDLFTKQEIGDIAMKLHLSKELDDLIEVMRTECFLLLKGPKLYQLRTT